MRKLLLSLGVTTVLAAAVLLGYWGRAAAQGNGTTTTVPSTRRPSAGPSGVVTRTGLSGTSRVASAASSRLIRTAMRRNSSGGVETSRSVASAS